MKTKNLLKYAAAALAIAGPGGFAVDSAMAANPGDPATLGATAVVSIDSVLNIAENQQIDFGTIFRDPSGDELWTMNPTSGGFILGDGANVSSGTPKTGDYDITGNTALTLTLEITVGACTAGSGLSLQGMFMDVGGGLLVASPAVSGLSLNAHVDVGAQLLVAAAGIDGAATCAYTMIANY